MYIFGKIFFEIEEYQFFFINKDFKTKNLREAAKKSSFLSGPESCKRGRLLTRCVNKMRQLRQASGRREKGG